MAASDSNLLRVAVNQELVLDAGSWRNEVDSDKESWRTVNAPEVLMFDQLFDYLSTVSASDEPSPLMDEAKATVAVCLRWGSYFAVLADSEKSLYRPPRGERTSRIYDSEMARINIESSAALERWLKIKRNDPARYNTLVRAASYLPLALAPKLTEDTKSYALLRALTSPEISAEFSSDWKSEKSIGAERWKQAQNHPTRVIANGLINHCWRNGPVENIHAGYYGGTAGHTYYPLKERRLRPAEEKKLMTTAVKRFAGVIEALSLSMSEKNDENWRDLAIILNSNAASMFLIRPSNWSVTESTRAIRLYGAEA